jgi:hypothetical protein
MRIKLATILVIPVLIGLAVIAAGQPSSKLPGDQQLTNSFKAIVGRDPSADEISFWKAKQSTSIYSQIMDWFVAPAQAGERLAMIDKAYKKYFKRAASSSERSAVDSLVQQKKIPFEEILSTIGVEIDITGVADVVGDPHVLSVTVSNQSHVSTSSKSYVGIKFFEGTDCASEGTPAEKFEVPSLAPQQGATVKVSSSRILQQSNSQHPSFELLVYGGDNGYSNQSDAYASTRCIPRPKMSKGKLTGPNVPNHLPKGQSPAAKPMPTPRKP